MAQRSRVHERAVIDESLGPVRISDGCEIHAHAVLKGPLILHPGVKVYSGAVIGFDAEVYPPEGSNYEWPIEIGRETIIRENVVITRSSEGEKPQTTIGARCFLLDGCHVSHDCIVEDEVTIAHKVVLAGFCHVMWRAYLGIASSFHQRVVVGSVAMVGMGAVVVRNVEPGVKVVGVPTRVIGQNHVGLARAEVDETRMAVETLRWRSICAQRVLEPVS